MRAVLFLKIFANLSERLLSTRERVRFPIGNSGREPEKCHILHVDDS